MSAPGKSSVDNKARKHILAATNQENPLLTSSEVARCLTWPVEATGSRCYCVFEEYSPPPNVRCDLSWTHKMRESVCIFVQTCRSVARGTVGARSCAGRSTARSAATAAWASRWTLMASRATVRLSTLHTTRLHVSLVS